MRMKLLITICAAVMLTGCAQQNQNNSTLCNDPGTKQAEMQLANSARTINKSLRELAQVQRATYPKAKMPPPPNARKIGMAHLASIDWSGPIQPLVKNIAKVTHYRLRVLGRAPAIPVLVSVNATNVPIATILRNAAFQCGNKVDIVVYPRRKIIELRYARV